jgi:phosphoribosylformylglycinamidine synthase
MWPCRNEGEDARLYDAVKAASDFAIALGINIPTGKDSLSMTQKYKNGERVISPGTVIISAAAEVTDIRSVVEPVLKNDKESCILYIDFSSSGFSLGGSAFSQVVGCMGEDTPSVKDFEYFAKAFNTIQSIVKQRGILAGHDVSAGGLITALLEMNFASNNNGMELDISGFSEKDVFKIFFAENPAIVIQVKEDIKSVLKNEGVNFVQIGRISDDRCVSVNGLKLDIDYYREKWYKTSYLLEKKQTVPELAKKRYENYKKQPLFYNLPDSFTGKLGEYGIEHSRKNKSGIKAAIIREKGVNGDREMAWAMYLAGMDVKDVHMTDLITGRENLEDVNMIVFVGGFSNSDVLGSAKGWAGAFLYNEKAKAALDNFYERKDTLSLGVCNGCQLMIELGLITPEHDKKPKMLHNDSLKFESAFLTVDIPKSDSIMLKTLENSRLGIWVAHGEGKFSLPLSEDKYNVALKYSYNEYPGNPNGSDFSVAGIVSDDGRHLAMMPHLERAIYPWNWANYPIGREDEVTPWIEAFINAKKWIEDK